MYQWAWEVWSVPAGLVCALLDVQSFQRLLACKDTRWCMFALCLDVIAGQIMRSSCHSIDCLYQITICLRNGPPTLEGKTCRWITIQEYAAFTFRAGRINIAMKFQLWSYQKHHIIRMLVSENLQRNVYSCVYRNVLCNIKPYQLALTINGRPG